MLNKKHRNAGFAHIIILVIILLIFGIVTYVYLRKQTTIKSVEQTNKPSQQVPKKPFTFSAVGDIGSSPNAALVLSKIGASKNDFTLALGDLGYGGNGTENTWCDFVKKHVGDSHPFQLVAGNHDDGSKDGSILEYRKCLPNKVGKITGEYGLEYYFDYQNLARFILISPDIDSLGYTYDKNSEHYNWLSKTIDEARNNDLEWVVVGMHKNCISVGQKTCEIGEDLLNLLVEKKVDLILQGHEHAYMRSKQLMLDKNCPIIAINSTNSTCISGTGNKLTKGRGSVIVVSGTGGVDLRDIQTNDSESGYFETWNGKNVGNSYGFSLFGVNSREITGEFVRVNGSYADSFSISEPAHP